jgi:hypothetical protein
MNSFPTQLTNSSGVSMMLDPNRLLLGLQSPDARDRISTLLKDLDVFMEDDNQDQTNTGERVNHTEKRLWVQSRQVIDEDRYQKIDATLRPAGLDWIGPVSRLANATGRKALVSPLPHVVLVEFRDRHVGEPESISSLFSDSAGTQMVDVAEDLVRSK